MFGVSDAAERPEMSMYDAFIKELTDIMLYGYSQPICPNRIFGGTSRLALMIMTRTIVEYMASEEQVK